MLRSPLRQGTSKGDIISQEFKSMKKILSGLLILSFLTVQGCVIWYSGEPELETITYAKATKDKPVLHYAVYTADPEFKKAVRTGLSNSNQYKSLIEHYALADFEKEESNDPYFLEVSIQKRNIGGLGVIWTYFTWYLTLGVLPGWTQDGLIIEYKLYERKGSKFQTIDTETYDPKRRSISWLGLLPFFWVNMMTKSSEDVIALTAMDYTAKLTEKGYLFARTDDVAPGSEFKSTVYVEGDEVFHSVNALIAVDNVIIVKPDGKYYIRPKDKIIRIVQ